MARRRSANVRQQFLEQNNTKAAGQLASSERLAPNSLDSPFVGGRKAGSRWPLQLRRHQRQTQPEGSLEINRRRRSPLTLGEPPRIRILHTFWFPWGLH